MFWKILLRSFVSLITALTIECIGKRFGDFDLPKEKFLLRSPKRLIYCTTNQSFEFISIHQKKYSRRLTNDPSQISEAYQSWKIVLVTRIKTVLRNFIVISQKVLEST